MLRNGFRRYKQIRPARHHSRQRISANSWKGMNAILMPRNGLRSNRLTSSVSRRGQQIAGGRNAVLMLRNGFRRYEQIRSAWHHSRRLISSSSRGGMNAILMPRNGDRGRLFVERFPAACRRGGYVCTPLIFQPYRPTRQVRRCVELHEITRGQSCSIERVEHRAQQFSLGTVGGRAQRPLGRGCPLGIFLGQHDPPAEGAWIGSLPLGPGNGQRVSIGERLARHCGLDHLVGQVRVLAR